ncbi:MAG: fumarate hydratase [Candidatus Firestonebacteria bacterium]
MISQKTIINAVRDLCIKANLELRPDVVKALGSALKKENTPGAKRLLSILLENCSIAKNDRIPICQDTGMAVVFVELGQNAKIQGSLSSAINKGVAAGYKNGFLRKSIVSDPLLRKNTGTNTPAVIYYDLLPGRSIKLTVLPKGFGSENKSKLYMLNPTAGYKEIVNSVLQAVKEAGPDACPPYVVGVGIGGDAAKACYLAKKALTKPVGFNAEKPHFRIMAKEILLKGNKFKIGPLGAGGKPTLLGVNILSMATHIAGLPVAVNISCHALRSATAVIPSTRG